MDFNSLFNDSLNSDELDTSCNKEDLVVPTIELLVIAEEVADDVTKIIAIHDGDNITGTDDSTKPTVDPLARVTQQLFDDDGELMFPLTPSPCMKFHLSWILILSLMILLTVVKWSPTGHR